MSWRIQWRYQMKISNQLHSPVLSCRTLSPLLRTCAKQVEVAQQNGSGNWPGFNKRISEGKNKVIFPLHQFADLASQTAVPTQLNGHPGTSGWQDSSPGWKVGRGKWIYSSYLKCEMVMLFNGLLYWLSILLINPFSDICNCWHIPEWKMIVFRWT